MKVEVPIEEMRKRKIFVATPMYGGQCHGMFTKACVDLQALSMQYGVEVKFFYLFNESLITRARNYLVDEFLRSDSTHLMFIDSDICFNPQDVLALAAMADPKDDSKDVVCGPYPKKCIAWERIVSAVKHGFADENPAALEQLVGDFVFNPVGGTERINIGEPVEVLEGGTGFMCIQRRVFERWNESYPDQLYTPDHNRSEHFDGTRKIMAYFDTVIDPNQNRYLSEDYMFCQWSRNIGLHVWMCPWMQMTHVGTYNFSGNLPAIAQIPNASHGGLVDQPGVKTATPQKWGAGIPKPAAGYAAPSSAPASFPPSIASVENGMPPNALTEEAANRRERRKQDMEQRRAAKKKNKKKKASNKK